MIFENLLPGLAMIIRLSSFDYATVSTSRRFQSRISEHRVGYYSGFTAGFRREKIKASSPSLFPLLAIGLSNFPGKI